uniref:NADH-ubiquinone oxidoreductase chain 5 n=1 Tax=Aureoumbra lagunensis TaxID=44058 RepID=A0A7U0KRI6_9STRA|nr:NADH dehydrogenase subunit 5 [Aureoumbra lagunensis]QQW50390.1 NADH dehydrogenase subunit 5 [Aureoumbra lagunensis]
MYLSAVFLPFLGAFFSGIFGRFLGSKGAVLLTSTATAMAAVLSFCIFYEVSFCGSVCYLKMCSWINVEFFYNDWGFLFDVLTGVMLVVVSFISTLVHFYSSEYMSHDPCLPRFMSYLSLFTAFMLVLVSADNLIQMFLGWEGIGLASYLLINFWFSRLQANKAAIKAMLVNRIGDFCLALAIFLIYFFFQTVEYDSVFVACNCFKEQTVNFVFFESSMSTVAGILLFFGAVGKSAQIGLHTWLPDAMEGPTPVSALIHAATLVTAGVFLIARTSPILENSEIVLSIISLFGAFTAFFAASTGLLQNDLKRVIAYSTCSQLGYMMFACGFSNYSTGIFHLANHAFFKALLFLSAGSIIHGVQDEQDLRKFGGLRKLLPFTYAMVFIGSSSLMGFPFLTGYYSKDFILENAYAKFSVTGHFCFWLGCFAAFFTAFYSIRLLFLVFLAEPNGFRPILSKAHESSLKISIPLGILAIPSIILGYFFQEMFIGIGTHFWGNSIFVLPSNVSQIDAEFIPFRVKILPVFFSLTGAFLAFFLFSEYKRLLYELKKSVLGKLFYIFLNKKWFFDKVYNEFLIQHLFTFGYSTTYKTLDKGLVELLMGPKGFAYSSFSISNLLKNFQSGFIYHYSFFLFISASFFIFITVISKTSFFLFDLKLLSVFFFSIFASNLKITH